MNYKCKVCDRPLGRYAGWDLCAQCGDLYKQEKIVRTRMGYQRVNPWQEVEQDMIYEKKRSIQSYREMCYYQAFKEALPANYLLFPQVAVSAVIVRTDGTSFQSELNRVFDFLVVDKTFKPVLAIELNDSTHNTYERRQRDINLARICGEAGLPLEFIECNIEQAKSQIIKALEAPGQTDRKTYIYKVYKSIPTPTPMPNVTYVPTSSTPPKCSWWLMLFYTVFFGWLGLHRFYAEKMISGVIYLMTLGLFGVGWVIDIFAVLTTLFRDKQRRRIKI